MRDAGVGVDINIIELDRNGSEGLDGRESSPKGTLKLEAASQEGGWMSSSSYSQSIWRKMVARYTRRRLYGMVVSYVECTTEGYHVQFRSSLSTTPSRVLRIVPE